MLTTKTEISDASRISFGRRLLNFEDITKVETSLNL